MTSIAFGTHACHGPLEPLLQEALRMGCVLFDTAPNYQQGSAQEILGRTLYKKPRVRRMTKVGFFPTHEATFLLKQGLIDENDAAIGHSLNTAYIKHQVLSNIKAFQSNTIDTLFLHNPERREPFESREEIYEKIQSAFEILDQFSKKGLIKRYGIATWSGFESQNAKPLLTIESLLEMAKNISDTSPFKAIQVPLSLVKQKVIFEALHHEGPLWKSNANRIEIFGSSPLHGGKLPPLLNKAFCESIEPSLTAAQACLLFSKSVPFVSAVLTSPSTILQVQSSFKVSKLPKLTEEKLKGILNLFKIKP